MAATSPEWRVRKHPVAGWWAEFRPPGRRRWLAMLGSPFRTERSAQEAVEEHQQRLLSGVAGVVRLQG